MADRLEVPVLNVLIFSNEIIVRYLGHAKELPENQATIIYQEADLLKPTRYGAFWKRGNPLRLFFIHGRYYVILGETIFRKTSPEVAYNYVPGTHFVFHYDPLRGARVDAKGTLSYFTKCSTADLIRTMGGFWYFDIWVRDQNAPLTECARSITTATGSYLIKNFDELGEQWTAEEVMKGGQSKWLNLAYSLTSKTGSVTPWGGVEFEFQVLDGKTRELATDVTWDGFVIEAVDGYVPHKRLSVVNGVGRFKGMALGLVPGESMRVKINRRYQTSIAECTVPVVPKT